MSRNKIIFLLFSGRSIAESIVAHARATAILFICLDMMRNVRAFSSYRLNIHGLLSRWLDDRSIDLRIGGGLWL